MLRSVRRFDSAMQTNTASNILEICLEFSSLQCLFFQFELQGFKLYLGHSALIKHTQPLFIVDRVTASPLSSFNSLRISSLFIFNHLLSNFLYFPNNFFIFLLHNSKINPLFNPLRLQITDNIFQITFLLRKTISNPRQSSYLNHQSLFFLLQYSIISSSKSTPIDSLLLYSHKSSGIPLDIPQLRMNLLNRRIQIKQPSLLSKLTSFFLSKASSKLFLFLFLLSFAYLAVLLFLVLKKFQPLLDVGLNGVEKDDCLLVSGH